MLRIICLVLTLLSIPVAGFAQSARGSMAGTVTDTSGAVIVGAKVVATQIETGTTTETLTTSTGDFRLPELPIGRYNVTISATGFETQANQGVLITLNNATPLNVTLKAGATTEVVNVDASSPAVQSVSSDFNGTISEKQITDLPLSLTVGVGALRSPETFMFLVPGTTGPGSGDQNGANGVFLAKIAGGQSYGAETLLDGSSITRSENGSSFDETSPSVEALQELKVTTSIPEAEFGRTTAGIESFSTRSGANQYHGTAFTIIKNAVFDGNNWFNNGYWDYYNCAATPLSANCKGYKRQEDSKFDYGGTLGGAFRIPHLYNGHDRSFFFFAWEQLKWNQGVQTTSTVPTAAEKTGDFSAVLGGPTSVINPCTGAAVLQNQIFDPATTNDTVSATNPNGVPCRYPFAGNQVPLRSKVAQALVKGLPDPNQAATPTIYGFQNNYAQPFLNQIMNTTYTVRVDQSIGQSNKIFASYNTRDNFRYNGSPNLPIPYNNSGYPQDFETHYIRIGWDYTITPKILNHLNVGYNRTNSKNFSKSIDASITTKTAGAPNFYGNSFPDIGWDGLDSFSGWGVGNNGDNIDNGLRFNDSVNLEKGRNSFKFGIDWRHQQYSVINDTIPTINFLRSETDVAALGGIPQFQSGNSFAGFLLGEVDNSNQTVYNHASQWNSKYIAGFFQDDLKMGPRLTLNLGVRYEIDFPRHEHLNDTSQFSFTAPDTAAGNLPGAFVFGTNCHCDSAWAGTWKKDLAPRIGFAYTLPYTHDKAVLRGGAGIIYGPLQYSDFGGAMALGYTQNRGTGSFFTGPGTAGGFTPAFNLDTGNPQWTPSFFAPNTDPTQLTGGTGVFNSVGGEVITKAFGRPSMTEQWGLQIQDEIAADLIATVGYAGQNSQNLHSGFLTNSNNIDPKYFSLGDHLSDPGSAISTPGGTSQYGNVKAPYSAFLGNLGQALRPYPQYDYIAGDCCLENIGHASYHAMLVSLNRRFRQGFNLQLAYTWSKNETDADSTIPFSYDAYRSQTQNVNDLHQEKSVSIQNIPQQLSISYLYQLPFGKGQRFFGTNKLADEIIGGWQFGAIQRYQTGQNMDFGCGTGAAYYQNCFRFTRGPAASGNDFASAAFKANKNKPSFFNHQSWFKPAFRPAGFYGPNDAGTPLAQSAFVDMNREGPGWMRQPSASCADGCSFDPFVFGTGIPRITQAITQPAYKAEDFSLMKNFAITERVKFQLKGEAFDVFNRHRMGLPDTEPADYIENSPTGFGIPTYVDYGPRTMQVTGRINF
jgi:hypothetical protein